MKEPRSKPKVHAFFFLQCTPVQVTGKDSLIIKWKMIKDTYY